MLFNSFEFILVFLPLVLAIYHLCRKKGLHHQAMVVLVLASLVFYTYWDWKNLPVLLASLLVNYLIAGQLLKHRRKPYLVAGIAFNLGMLGFYKYMGFFLGEISAGSFNTFSIVLPLAISFFTFQQIGYLIDAYKGHIKEQRLLDYCLFVVFFPQLIAGPIVHHSVVMPQFNSLKQGHSVPVCFISSGLYLFSLGLAKKVLVADFLAGIANPIFSNASQVQILDAWVGSLSYTFQLYFDFSGYCDMAMGIALMFGVFLPVNFNSPYKARNIQQFWQRWHITLGQFLKQYLYIPLGGNRHGTYRTLLALMITMILGGLWHGAGWTFVAWGLMHGLYLCIYVCWSKQSVRLPSSLSLGLTFMAVVLAWVMFRAESVGDAVVLWQTMAGLNGVVLPSTFQVVIDASEYFTYASTPFITGLELLMFIVFLEVVFKYRNTLELSADFVPSVRACFYTIVCLTGSVLSLSQPSEFLYFQF